MVAPTPVRSVAAIALSRAWPARGTTLYCEKLIWRRVLRLKPALNAIKARLHTVMNQG
jgi:hypothetical protein